MKAAVMVVALVALSGCSLSPFYAQVRASIDQGIEQAVDDRMEYNDDKAQLILKLPCDISIGAYYRLLNPMQRAGITMLCRPPDVPLPVN